MKYCIILILFIFFVSCDEQSSDEKFTHVECNQLSSYGQDVIDQCDTLSLEAIPSSYIGQLKFDDNKFYFVDEKFCRIYYFDMEGKFIIHKFNKGRSNTEITGDVVTGYTKLDNGNHCVVSSIVYSLYDTTYRRYKTKVLNTENGSIVDASNPAIYTMSYDKFILKTYKNFIYYNVTLQHPDFNFIEHPEITYYQASNLFIYDIEKDEVVGMIGKYPEMYRNSDHNQFSLINFDVNRSGFIYLSFEADENIYIYDSSFKPTICFGVAGKEMNVNYPKLTTYNDFRTNYVEHRQKYSFYKDILYLESFDYIARIYSKDTADRDGLQIYNNSNALIADLSIPKECKIAGADSKYLYLYNLDSGYENIKLYKIKL